MKRLRVYVDTSVLGGCFDDEFAEWSNRLGADFRAGRYIPVLSDVTSAEVIDAPADVRAIHEELLAIAGQVVPVDTEATVLLEAYEKREILGPRFRNDMLHVAIATIADADVLVSWNFRHVVRLDKIRSFNAVNLELGYKPLTISSPREVITYADEED